MKKIISNAKSVLSKAILVASCRVEIARAVLAYTVAEYRLKKLHPVRHARKRETISYQYRANRLACDLAVQKLGNL
ncbi:TPA: hypothetical protein L5U90_003552 [Pseudomonas aeruginosa]|nr:hypothetical protein [Pseudomonas aeruginosa]